MKKFIVILLCICVAMASVDAKTPRKKKAQGNGIISKERVICKQDDKTLMIKCVNTIMPVISITPFRLQLDCTEYDYGVGHYIIVYGDGTSYDGIFDIDTNQYSVTINLNPAIVEELQTKDVIRIGFVTNTDRYAFEVDPATWRKIFKLCYSEIRH